MKRIILIISALLIFLRCLAPGTEQDIKRSTEKWLYTAELTPENLMIALELNSIRARDTVFAQGRLETGNFTSILCLQHNNLFGMRKPLRRQTTALGSAENNYAAYATWYDCVKDMSLFQEWYLSRGRDLTDYFLFLEEIGYAEDAGYLKKLEGLCLL